MVIHTRLGLDKINPIYLKSMEKMFEINSFSGILGNIFWLKGGGVKCSKEPSAP